VLFRHDVRQDRNSTWWMPWRVMPMTDAGRRRYAQGSGDHASILRFPNGATRLASCEALPNGRGHRAN
jgi:hypothetical protein